MEHRKENRTPLLIYLDIFDRQTQQNLGYLGDVSATGMMFISMQKLPLAQVIDIRIALPGTATLNFEHANNIDLQIKVVWEKPHLNPEWFCIGCHFTQISDADRALLQQVGQALGFAQDVQVSRVSA